MIHKFYSSHGKKISEPLLESIPPQPGSSYHFFRINEPNLPFAWHYHPEIEIDLYLEGEGLRFVGDSVEHFRTGDLCLLGPNLPHSWTTQRAPGKRLQSIFLQFLPEWLGSNFLERPELQAIRRLLQRSGRGLRFYGKTQRLVSERIVALEKSPAGNWRRLTDLISILGLLAESRECKPLASATFTASNNLEADKKLHRVLKFVNSDSETIPTQELAARHASMSPQAFSRFFKRYVGKNYAQFRNEIRINRACWHLLNRDESITETSLRSGFDNLSNFNEQFRRIKGMTPRDYRKKWRLA